MIHGFLLNQSDSAKYSRRARDFMTRPSTPPTGIASPSCSASPHVFSTTAALQQSALTGWQTRLQRRPPSTTSVDWPARRGRFRLPALLSRPWSVSFPRLLLQLPNVDPRSYGRCVTTDHFARHPCAEPALVWCVALPCSTSARPTDQLANGTCSAQQSSMGCPTRIPQLRSPCPPSL